MGVDAYGLSGNGHMEELPHCAGQLTWKECSCASHCCDVQISLIAKTTAGSQFFAIRESCFTLLDRSQATAGSLSQIWCTPTHETSYTCTLRAGNLPGSASTPLLIYQAGTFALSSSLAGPRVGRVRAGCCASHNQ